MFRTLAAAQTLSLQALYNSTPSYLQWFRMVRVLLPAAKLFVGEVFHEPLGLSAAKLTGRQDQLHSILRVN